MRRKGDKTQKIEYSLLVLAILMFSILVISNTNAIEDYVTISVNVSSVTMVDINPSNLSWTNVPPGGIGDSTNELNNYSSVWIENIGSTNISYVWFNNTYPSSLPFGTGNSQNYDAANFAVISNGTSNFMFINRVEYPEDDSLYVKTHNPPDITQGNIFGRFRNSSFEYFWEFNSASGTQNCTSGNFYISDTPKTQSDTGDADLRDNIAITFVDVGGYGVGEVSLPNGDTYCVAIPENCDHVMFNKWNRDGPGVNTTACQNVTGFFIDGSSDPLVPGEVGKANIKVYVPFGVPYGPVKDGTLTVIVEA